VDFLKDYEWQWFATLTFKEAIHPEAAGKKFKLWTKLLDESHGVKPRKPLDHPSRCHWARGLEWQKREVLHFHALLGNVPTDLNTRAHRRVVEESWLSLDACGFARVELVESGAGAVQYVTKYCAKGGEIDLSPNLPLPQLFLTDPASAA
jgi:hypothetical protein